jgi:hypothetical protein
MLAATTGTQNTVIASNRAANLTPFIAFLLDSRSAGERDRNVALLLYTIKARIIKSNIRHYRQNP